MAGIGIDITANTRDFIRGTKDAGDALEKVSDSLDDLARDAKRDADKAGDALEKGIKDGARDADKAVDKLENSFKDLADNVKRESKRAGSALSTNVRKGKTEASESVKELGNEAKQNAAETFSSFDGSAQSLLGGIQGTFGGIVSSLGPMGAIAGAAGAIGIGLISTAFDNAGESDEEFKAKVADLANEFIETGRVGSTSLDFIVDRLKTMATVSDGSEKNLKDLRRAADESDNSFKRLARAYAGNVDELDDLQKAGYKHLAGLIKESLAIDQSTESGRKQRTEIEKKIRAQENYNTFVDDGMKIAKEAAKEQENYAKAGGPELAARAAATQEYAESVQSALTDAGSAWEDYNDDGKTSLAEYNQHIEESIKAITSYQKNMVTASSTLSQDALNYIESLGQDAAPILQAYVDAPLDQKERTAKNWGILGAAASDKYIADLKAGVPATIAGPKIVPQIDSRSVADELNKWRNTSVSIPIIFKNRSGKRVP